MARTTWLLSKTSARFISITLLIILATGAVAQSKPERQSKATKPTAETPKAPRAEEQQQPPSTEPKPTRPEEKPFKGMQYRLIGPFRGGRSLTAAGVPGDPSTYYFGATGGGVWKSTDGAVTWAPVFDKEGTSSIGSLAVANSNPNVIYAGTGEACIRGNISHGDGVYKSLDGGKSWKNVGLRDSRAIGKIIIHPANPDIVFVAALGHPFGPNPERGIFRTSDGGKTWEKVLYKDENTGGIDVTFDPQNPNILFAALWQAQRTPWSMSNGGPGSGPIARPTQAQPGNASRGMVCPRASTERSGLQSRRTPSAYLHLFKRKILTAGCIGRTTAANHGDWSTRATACGSAPGITCTSLPIPGMKKPFTS
jgi:hypothetical protein